MLNSLNITIQKKDIIKALGFATGIIEKRNIRPILGNILLEAKENKLKIVATSIDISLSMNIPAEVKSEGLTTVNVTTFMDIIRKLKDDKINLKYNPNTEILDIHSGMFDSNLTTLQASEFPSIEGIENSKSFKLEISKILRILNHTEFAMSTEESRYNLNGVYLNSINENLLNCTAIDGHRLATATEESSDIPELSVILPKKTVNELIKILKESSNESNECIIEFNNYRIEFLLSNIKLSSKLIDATFPNYKSLIPQFEGSVISVHSNLIKDSIDRVSTINSDKFKAVKLKISEKIIEISAFGESKGSAIEIIDNSDSEKFILNGNEVTFGFNPIYMIDVLKILENDEVEICIKNSESPILIRSSKFPNDSYIVMPIRV